MRPFYLFLSLFCILALAACGTEEELIPPNIKVDGATTSILVKDPSVTITGTIDDLAATLVANSTATGERSVDVNRNDGSWSFTFAPLTIGANIVSFTATDKRGNLNQMILNVNYDPTPPNVTAVVQSVTDPEKPQLIVTFDEALLESSLTTTLFSVVNVDKTFSTGFADGILVKYRYPDVDCGAAGGHLSAHLPGNRRIWRVMAVATNSFDFTILIER